MTRIVLDFFGVTILCAILFAVIAYFFPGLGSPSGAVTTVVAALVAGQLYGRRTGAEVSSGFAWKVAFVLTALSLILAALVLLGLPAMGIAVMPDAPISFVQLLFALVFVGGLSLLAIRFTFRMDVKQGSKIK